MRERPQDAIAYARRGSTALDTAAVPTTGAASSTPAPPSTSAWGAAASGPMGGRLGKEDELDADENAAPSRPVRGARAPCKFA